MTCNQREKYEEMLKTMLTPYRFQHSLNVSQEAVRIAGKYGVNPEKAELAGLLHDIMKDADKEKQIALLPSMNGVEKNTPKLWHAMAGAVYLKQNVGITDSDIIHAVRYHTTARAGMSQLEKVIYLADFTSAERDYTGVEKLRSAIDVTIEYAMEAALAFSIESLIQKKCAIHPDTVFAYNEIILARKKGN